MLKDLISVFSLCLDFCTFVHAGYICCNFVFDLTVSILSLSQFLFNDTSIFIDLCHFPENVEKEQN